MKMEKMSPSQSTTRCLWADDLYFTAFSISNTCLKIDKCGRRSFLDNVCESSTEKMATFLFFYFLAMADAGGSPAHSRF